MAKNPTVESCPILKQPCSCALGSISHLHCLRQAGELGEKLDELETNWETEARLLASGLAWAVGLIQGLGHEPGYAQRVLDRYENPRVKMVTGLSPAEDLAAEAQRHSKDFRNLIDG